MPLLLQPVFMDLFPVTDEIAEDSTTQRRDSNSSSLRPKLPPGELSSDSLYSMWKVATKVKTVMPEGARFENLTWRAWYRRTLLDKKGPPLNVCGSTLETAGDNQPMTMMMTTESYPSITKNQNRQTSELPNGPSPLNSSIAYTAILAEIQEAAKKINSYSPKASGLVPVADLEGRGFRASSLPSTPFTSKIGPVEMSQYNIIFHGSGQSEVFCNRCGKESCRCMSQSESHPTSESSVSTSNISTLGSTTSGPRKKKKNVEKFLKRQTMESITKLEIIEEQREESSTSSYKTDTVAERRIVGKQLNSDLHMPITKFMPMEYSSVSTTDTLSVSDSEREISSGNSSRIGRSSSQVPNLFRLSHEQTKALSDKPNVSLLTMLLNRSNEVSRRPDSCPPPFSDISPPPRPDAPLPSRRFSNNFDDDQEESPSAQVICFGSSTSRVSSQGQLNSSRVSPQESTPSEKQFNLNSRNSPTSSRLDRRRNGPSANDYPPRMSIW